MTNNRPSAVTGHPSAERVARALGWRAAVPLARRRAVRRLDRLAVGRTTVVTVNWNSWEHLAVLLDVVRRRSPQDVEVLVVDNGSTDGSRQRLRLRRDVRKLLSPVNLGHDLAMDLAVLSCRTEFFVTLDVDAFPLRDGWLDDLLAPLHSGAQISGARLWRPYVHPCCLAMRTARFVTARHSFRSHYEPARDGELASGDVGEDISAAEAPHLHFFDVTSQRGPGDVGTVFGDLVYHNFYGTRFGEGHSRLDGVVTPGDPRAAWTEAVARYVL